MSSDLLLFGPYQYSNLSYEMLVSDVLSTVMAKEKHATLAKSLYITQHVSNRDGPTMALYYMKYLFKDAETC